MFMALYGCSDATRHSPVEFIHSLRLFAFGRIKWDCLRVKLFVRSFALSHSFHESTKLLLVRFSRQRLQNVPLVSGLLIPLAATESLPVVSLARQRRRYQQCDAAFAGVVEAAHQRCLTHKPQTVGLHVPYLSEVIGEVFSDLDSTAKLSFRLGLQ